MSQGIRGRVESLADGLIYLTNPERRESLNLRFAAFDRPSAFIYPEPSVRKIWPHVSACVTTNRKQLGLIDGCALEDPNVLCITLAVSVNPISQSPGPLAIRKANVVLPCCSRDVMSIDTFRGKNGLVP